MSIEDEKELEYQSLMELALDNSKESFVLGVCEKLL
jgi:hypothetical protein